jgi:hypothetical protein
MTTKVELTDAQNSGDIENQIVKFLPERESDSFGEFKIHSGVYDTKGRPCTILIEYNRSNP